MHTSIYISLNIFYFLFCVLLVNTIRKEFFTQSEKNIISSNSQEIFIPEDRENNAIYISKLLKSPLKPKYIFILPMSDSLVSKSGLWNILRSKYYRNITYLNNFLLRSYIVENYLDRQLLEQHIYTKNQKFPMRFILSNNKNKHKIFELKDKYDYYDLVSYYKENKYNIIQSLEDNIFVYQQKILTFESYILICKYQGNIKMYVFEDIKYLLFDLATGNYIKAQKVELLLKNEYFKEKYEEIIRNLYRNYKFLHKSIIDFLKLENILEDSKMFEIFKVNHFLDINFNLYLFDINRKINYISEEDKLHVLKLVNQGYNLIRDQINLEDSNFLEVS